MRYMTAAALAVLMTAIVPAEGIAAAPVELAQDETPPAEAGQDQDQDQPAAQPQPEGIDPAADQAAQEKEAQRLIAAFGHMLDASRQLGGFGEADLMNIERLKQDMELYNLRWPEDQRMIALQLQCCRWLGDRDCVDRLFYQLLELTPDSPAMAIVWADDLYSRNEYRRVLEVIDLANQSPEDIPALGYLKAKALFAENRFEEAQEALAILPESPRLKANHLLDLNRLREVVPEYIPLWEEEQARRDAEAEADDLPIVALETERGTIKLELFEDQAPVAVSNFITLTEEGFYDNTLFHRVVGNHVTQGGDPHSKPDVEGAVGQGGPGYRIPDEHNEPEARMHFAGSLGMAHGPAPNSAGSQFYIMHEPKPNLNGGYTVFGRVIEGLDIARQIKQDEKLIRAFVVRKRDRDYDDFQKLTGESVPAAQPNTSSTAEPATPAPATTPEQPASTPGQE